MKMIINNKEQISVLVTDLLVKFHQYQALSVEYDKPEEPKTKKQLGFIFGALIDSAQDYFNSNGDFYDKRYIKEELYRIVAIKDARLRKIIKDLRGNQFEVPLPLSEMDKEQASLFINYCIDAFDNDDAFKGLVLHPSIRYTWVNHISADDFREIDRAFIPERDSVYMEHTRKQACLWCGASNTSRAYRLRGAGIAGIDNKAGDVYTVPLCSMCHEGRLQRNGVDAFLKACSWITKVVPLETFCRIRYFRWKNGGFW